MLLNSDGKSTQQSSVILYISLTWHERKALLMLLFYMRSGVRDLQQNGGGRKCLVIILYELLKNVNVLISFSLFPQNELPDTHAKFHVLFLFFVAAMFFISILSLFSYHCWLVGKNRSTIGQLLEYGTVSRPEKCIAGNERICFHILRNC